MKKKEKCKHAYCRNKPAPNRKECYRCRSYNYRQKFELDFIYYWLKQSAKKRNLEFDLIKEDFKKFVIETGYVKTRGRFSEQTNIDRIDNLKGYITGNIQVLNKIKNIEKYYNDLPF